MGRRMQTDGEHSDRPAGEDGYQKAQRQTEVTNWLCRSGLNVECNQLERV